MPGLPTQKFGGGTGFQQALRQQGSSITFSQSQRIIQEQKQRMTNLRLLREKESQGFTLRRAGRAIGPVTYFSRSMSAGTSLSPLKRKGTPGSRLSGQDSCPVDRTSASVPKTKPILLNLSLQSFRATIRKLVPAMIVVLALECPITAGISDVDLAVAPTKANPYVRVYGSSLNDQLGNSVTHAGDVNNDGYADIVVGASAADPLGRAAAGAAYLIFGQAGITNTTFDTAALTSATGIKIIGPTAGQVGYSVSSLGDLNKDGYDDIIIGATGYSPPSKFFAGGALVIFGKATASWADIDASTDVAAAGLGFWIYGAAMQDFIGASVDAAGDFNNDGNLDIVVGGYGVDRNSISAVGGAYVIFGQGTATTATNIDLATFTPSSTTGFRIYGTTTSENCGLSVSGVGDVNNDGFDDVLVGCQATTYSGRASAGSVFVLFGHNSATPYIDLYLAVMTSAYGFVINGPAANANMGYSVSAAGDVNDDGIDDIVVGAYKADPPSKTDAGAVYVIFGRSSGFSDIDTATFTSGSNGFIVVGAASSNNLGRSVGGGVDVDGDGIDDIVVGASAADPPSRSGAGISYVILGHPSSFTFTDIDAASLTSTQGSKILGEVQGDQSGISVAIVPDFDGDGGTEVLVGAFTTDPLNRISAGTAYLLYVATGSASTAAPTAGPTVNPTMSPTSSTTSGPTVDPTMSPSSAPTALPSNAPSTGPTVAPTPSPTPAPSAPQTEAPTQPSVAPTPPPPTVAPSADPSTAPTTSPTQDPTLAPSSAPTMIPTAAPSEIPSPSPTLDPTMAPTADPSAEPTLAPTAVPSVAPTAAPTLCEMGTYSSSESGNCAPCPIGTYSDQVGASACEDCSYPYGTASTGNSQCDTVQVGLSDVGTAALFGLTGVFVLCCLATQAASLTVAVAGMVLVSTLDLLTDLVYIVSAKFVTGAVFGLCVAFFLLRAAPFMYRLYEMGHWYPCFRASFYSVPEWTSAGEGSPLTAALALAMVLVYPLYLASHLAFAAVWLVFGCFLHLTGVMELQRVKEFWAQVWRGELAAAFSAPAATQAATPVLPDAGTDLMVLAVFVAVPEIILQLYNQEKVGYTAIGIISVIASGMAIVSGIIAAAGALGGGRSDPPVHGVAASYELALSAATAPANEPTASAGDAAVTFDGSIQQV